MRYILWGLMLAAGPEALRATTIYAVTRAGALYRSADAATTWQQIPIPGVDAGSYASAIAIDPRNPSNIYIYLAGTSTPTGGRLRQDGPSAGLVHSLFHSTDGGQSWSQLALASNPNLSVRRLVIDSASPNILYAVTDTALVRSTDSGLTFSNAGVGLTISDVAPDPNQAGTVYAAGVDSTRSTALFKSVDSGRTWTAVAAPTLANSRGLSVRSVAVDPHSASNIYAAMAGVCPAGVTNCGLLRSTDGAKTWSAVSVQGDFYSVVFDPRNGDVYAAGAVGVGASLKGHIVKSTDGGKTWNALDAGLPAYPVRLYLDPGMSSAYYAAVQPNTGYSATSPVAILVSTDSGANWTGDVVTAQMTPNDLLISLEVTSGGAAAPPPGPPAGSVTRMVSAASLQDGPVAAESIVIATGTRLATGPANADYDQPATALAGTTVNVTDSAGVPRPALLFSVSATQVVYQIPPGTMPGTATVTITAGDGVVTTAQIQIAAVAPGLYTINPAGLARGYVLRMSNGNLFVEDVFDIDANGATVARPITVSNGDQVTLILYGTGFRAAGGDFSATAGGVSAPVLYGGPQGVQPGMDQVNLMLPPQVAAGGAQSIPVVLTAAGQAANTVYVTVQ
jgi:uncharacterized protein (TIGR03437 family)